MKYTLTTCFFVLFFTVLQAQQNVDTTISKSNLDEAAQQMIQLLTDKNYDEFANYVHPKIAVMAGGKDKLTALTKEAMDAAGKQGLDFQKATVDSATVIIVAGKELQSVITEHLWFKVQEGSVVATSYLLAISDNGGIKWYFADTSGKTLAQMKTVFPSLSGKLVIPAPAQPVFTHD